MPPKKCHGKTNKKPPAVNGGIVHPPIGRKNATYSPCRTWGVKNATDPTELRGTISTTIEAARQLTGTWRLVSFMGILATPPRPQ